MAYKLNLSLVEKNTTKLSLAEFYGISTIVGYLMPNPFYTYVEYDS